MLLDTMTGACAPKGRSAWRVGVWEMLGGEGRGGSRGGGEGGGQ